MTSFGRSMLSEWHLDPDYAYLNHGTVGATPKRVLQRQRDIIEEIERHPAEFMLRRLANPMAKDWEGEPPLLRQAATDVATYVGATDPDGGASGGADGLALVDNITTGANAVLGSLDIKPGDTLAVTNHGYGGVTNAVSRVAELTGASVQTVTLPSAGAPVADFADAFRQQVQPGLRLMVIDHITSFSALVMPIADMVNHCRDNGVPVLVDGAHVPAQLPLNVNELAPDWYSGNLHKWAWTPRSSGFLWVAPEHRHTIHAPIVSWGIGNGLAAEFDLPGTRDPSGFLAAGEAFAFRQELGEDAIRSYNHALAWTSADQLAQAWGTEFTTPEAMVGSMVVIKLPTELGQTVDDAERLRSHLSAEALIEIPVFSPDSEAGASASPDSLSLRLSTQIYNDSSDIERLEQAVLNLAAAAKTGAST